MDTLNNGQSSYMTMNLPLPSSTIAIPSLDTIPGSSAPTPTLHSPKQPPTPPPLPPGAAPPVLSEGGQNTYTAPSDYLTPVEGNSSRRSSIVGSYFPASAVAGPSTVIYPAVSPSPSGLSTPSRGPRPATLNIPLGTPDEPLFSAYPDQGPSTVSAKGKSRHFVSSLKPAFSLSHPRKNGRTKQQETSADSSSTSGRASPATFAPTITGRRRASTFSGSPPITAPLVELKRKSPAPFPPTTSPSWTSKALSNRRVSIHGHETDENYRDTSPTWPSMSEEVARRFGHEQISYSYQHPAELEYTLESVSTIATVRPLSSTPMISPRRSSLASSRSVNAPINTVLLGLTNISAEDNDAPVQIVNLDDMSMPHDPPPRHSSLDCGSSTSGMVESKDHKVVIESELPQIIPADHRSVLSASLTGTDTSASAEFFSETQSSKEHPLSSATTSLSRSAKSGKEGISDEKDAALSAIRLQRSLEWEARQTRHRRRLEKKRMILLELVETEVGYMDGLKTLVHVYLPQLYALPSVNERTADRIARNAKELLAVHERLADNMVNVLKEEKLGYDLGPEPVVSSQLEKVSRRLAGLFVEEVSAFSAYNEYCAGSIAAATIVRNISMRPEYNSYERRCQIISAAQPHPSLQDMLTGFDSDSPLIKTTQSAPSSPTSGTRSNHSRLHFRDFLIMPIQRVCRYPLLLNQLLASATTPSPAEHEHPLYPEDADGDYDTGIDVERALGAMRGVAEDADEARRIKENEIKSATIAERLEPHTALSPSFLKSLGTCRLVGSLDVLHHHPVVAPLVPPVKVKYLAAFLYRGYLILAKVKKGRVYEAKHFLPLEVFELIDITEGFLPHSIRLSLRDHSFDLAASCDTEKEVWASALCQARDESTIPPFELPASVSPFAAKSRRQSTHLSPETTFATLGPASKTPSLTPNKRHTLAMTPSELVFPLPPARHEDVEYVTTPAVSPSTKTTFGFTPDKTGRPGQPSTVLLRRASASQRLMVDRALIDIFSESCATARSKAQLHHALFLPDVPKSELRDGMAIKDSTTLRRRRSFLDSKHARQSSFDIAFTGEVKGSVMPIRQTRSYAGNKRTQPKKRFTVGQGGESSTEVDNANAGDRATDSAEETAVSDFGTLTRGASGISRTASAHSIHRAPSPTRQPSSSSAFGAGALGLAKRKSMTNIRKSIDMASESTTNLANMLTLTRRKTGTNQNKRPATPNRAKSVPVSPMSSPQLELHHRAGQVPSVPPAPMGHRGPRGSLSAHTSPSTRSVTLGQAGGDDETMVWTRGAGYTNRMPGPDRSKGWAGLRRSMSFLRDHNNNPSTSTLANLTADNTATNAGSSAMLYGGGEDGSGSASGSGSGASRPSYSRRTSTDLTAISATSGASSTTPSDQSAGHEDEDVDGRERVVFEEPSETPRRRRSTRMFSNLMGFTPI